MAANRLRAALGALAIAVAVATQIIVVGALDGQLLELHHDELVRVSEPRLDVGGDVALHEFAHVRLPYWMSSRSPGPIDEATDTRRM